MRLNANVNKIYCCLYDSNPEDLVVGLDALFFRPYNSTWNDRTRFWGHADHNCKNPQTHSDWSVFQSVVSIWPSQTIEDATTVVWPRSHIEIFPQMMDDPCVTPSGGHYVPLKNMCRENPRKGAYLRERFLREARR